MNDQNTEQWMDFLLGATDQPPERDIGAEIADYYGPLTLENKTDRWLTAVQIAEELGYVVEHGRVKVVREIEQHMRDHNHDDCGFWDRKQHGKVGYWHMPDRLVD